MYTGTMIHPNIFICSPEIMCESARTEPTMLTAFGLAFQVPTDSHVSIGGPRPSETAPVHEIHWGYHDV